MSPSLQGSHNLPPTHHAPRTTPGLHSSLFSSLPGLFFHLDLPPGYTLWLECSAPSFFIHPLGPCFEVTSSENAPMTAPHPECSPLLLWLLGPSTAPGRVSCSCWHVFTQLGRPVRDCHPSWQGGWEPQRSVWKAGSAPKAGLC